jgi:uncharacterized protein YciI
VLDRQLGHHGGAQALAEVQQPVVRDPRRLPQEPASRAGVERQALLGRAAGIAAVAPVVEQQHRQAVLSEGAGQRRAQLVRPGVATGDQHGRRRPRRGSLHVPRDQHAPPDPCTRWEAPPMEFLCYHRDRPGSTPLRRRLLEQHWSYMDRFATTMSVRGPTFTSDGLLTGSLHVLDLADAAAARAFAFDEPGYQAGAYRDVLLRRWRDSPGRTTRGVTADQPDAERYLVLGFCEPAADSLDLPCGDELIACGSLLSDDGTTVLGAAVLLEAPHVDAVLGVLSADHYAGVEVHRWRPGGRPE